MKLIFIFLFSFPLCLFAQDDFSMLLGKWQEDYRTDFKKKAVSFDDTIRIEFKMDTYLFLRIDNGLSTSGEATYRDKKISLHNVKFVVREVQEDELILRDENGIHYFKKVELMQLPRIVKVVPGVEEGEVDLSFNNMQGKWTCYKKLDPKFSGSTFYVKSLDIINEKSKGTFVVRVAYSSSDSVYFSSAIAKVTEQGMELTSETRTHTTTVLKASDNELILQDGNIHYFLKRFNKK